MEDLQKDLQDLRKKNMELEEKNTLPDTKANEEDVKEKMKESKDALQQGKKKKAQKAQKEAIEELEEIESKKTYPLEKYFLLESLKAEIESNEIDTSIADEARIGIIFTHILNENRQDAVNNLKAEESRFLYQTKYEEAQALLIDTETGLKLNQYIQLYR